MAVRKFRSIEEMSAAPELPSRRSAWERLCELLARAQRLHPRRFPPGVHKNRSIEQANARRASWTERRGSAPPR